tara:strand:- start:24326 stop:24718 length:393 start_codon:yes stop_codon:yes gene_type:complete
MKVSEFKKILKPLIVQTVKEVLLQEGVLSSVVAEVARGLNNNTIVEQKNTSSITQQEMALREERAERKRQEKIKRLNESNKFGDVFSGTRQIPDDSRGPMSGVSPGDTGVDISAIEKLSSGKWKTLMGQK